MMRSKERKRECGKKKRKKKVRNECSEKQSPNIGSILQSQFTNINWIVFDEKREKVGSSLAIGDIVKQTQDRYQD